MQNSQVVCDWRSYVLTLSFEGLSWVLSVQVSQHCRCSKQEHFSKQVESNVFTYSSVVRWIENWSAFNFCLNRAVMTISSASLQYSPQSQSIAQIRDKTPCSHELFKISKYSERVWLRSSHSPDSLHWSRQLTFVAYNWTGPKGARESDLASNHVVTVTWKTSCGESESRSER